MKLKLTKEEVEKISANATQFEAIRLVSSVPDLCDDWLAQREMLEEVQRVHDSCVCNEMAELRGWICLHCKLKELLG